MYYELYLMILFKCYTSVDKQIINWRDKRFSFYVMLGVILANVLTISWKYEYELSGCFDSREDRSEIAD